MVVDVGLVVDGSVCDVQGDLDHKLRRMGRRRERPKSGKVDFYLEADVDK